MEHQEKKTWSTLGVLNENPDLEEWQEALREVEHAFRRGYHHSWVLAAGIVQAMSKRGIPATQIADILFRIEEKVIVPWRENLAHPMPVPEVDWQAFLDAEASEPQETITGEEASA